MKFPLSIDYISKIKKQIGVDTLNNATIREIVQISTIIQKEVDNEPLIRFDKGIPGLPPFEIGVDAEIKALKNGIAAIYPNVEGISDAKEQMSIFYKKFMNLNIGSELCFPVSGSLQGSFASFIVLSKIDAKKKKILFVDPGFQVQKQQCEVLSVDYDTINLPEIRGNKFEKILKGYFETGLYSAILYSNPNNPTWLCLSDVELKVIGELSNQFDIIVIEDLAYFGMDFREDYFTGQEPFMPSITKYTSNYILLFSSSKIFSYAGQRIAMLALSENLYKKEYINLSNTFKNISFGKALINETLDSISSGTCHSAQYAFAAMLQSINNGNKDCINALKKYEKHAKLTKNIFLKYGFDVLYNDDLGRPLADGFYYTIYHPKLDSEELLHSLLQVGVTAISLKIAGSKEDKGIRICVSQIKDEQIELLDARLSMINSIKEKFETNEVVIHYQ